MRRFHSVVVRFPSVSITCISNYPVPDVRDPVRDAYAYPNALRFAGRDSAHDAVPFAADVRQGLCTLRWPSTPTSR